MQTKNVLLFDKFENPAALIVRELNLAVLIVRDLNIAVFIFKDLKLASMIVRDPCWLGN